MENEAPSDESESGIQARCGILFLEGGTKTEMKPTRTQEER